MEKPKPPPSGEAKKPRKPYCAPAISHTETVEARAITCNKVARACVPGPVTS